MNNTKISQAGYRMLEVLKALAQKPLTTQELLEYIEDTTDSNYRKEVILKYINTLKLLNINISKTNEKYYLQKSLECVDFNKRDLTILQFIKKYVEKINHDDLKDNIIESIQKIEQNFSQKTIDIVQNSYINTYRPVKPIHIYDSNVQKFEEYCKDGLKLEIVYKDEISLDEQNFVVAPLNLIYKKGMAILVAYYLPTNSYKEFLLGNILFVNQLPQKHTQCIPSTVLFKLKNRLAKSYILKKGETVLESGKDYLIISNKGEDKELLLKRLLRYYNQCEILYPKEYRKRLVEIVETLEKLYE